MIAIYSYLTSGETEADQGKDPLKIPELKWEDLECGLRGPRALGASTVTDASAISLSGSLLSWAFPHSLLSSGCDGPKRRGWWSPQTEAGHSPSSSLLAKKESLGSRSTFCAGSGWHQCANR